MSTELKELVKLKKSKLVKKADFNSASQMKKNKLIKKLADEELTETQKELLNSNAKEIKTTAKDLGIDYTTKKETLSKIIERFNNQKTESGKEKKTRSWYDEFRDAIDLAVRRTLSEKRCYKVLTTTENKNIFNVSPRYIQHDETKDVLLTITISEDAKQQLS